MIGIGGSKVAKRMCGRELVTCHVKLR